MIDKLSKLHEKYIFTFFSDDPVPSEIKESSNEDKRAWLHLQVESIIDR